MVLITTGAIQKNAVGRKKKPDSTKRTFRFNNINLEMLRIFADRNCLDMTSALNMLLNQNLSALGLKDEAQKNLEEQGGGDNA